MAIKERAVLVMAMGIIGLFGPLCVEAQTSTNYQNKAVTGLPRDGVTQ